MKTEGGHITGIQDAFTIDFHTERMGGIINHLQTVFVGDFLNALRVTGLAIHMHRHDGLGLWGDGSFYLVRVNVTRSRVNIHEHRLAAVPPQGMGGGHEAVWSGNHFTRDTKCL